MKCFEDKYARKPNLEFVTRTAFDAGYSLMLSIEAVGPDARAVKDHLYYLRFQGATGLVSFDANGDIVDLLFDVRRITGVQSVKLHRQIRK